MKLRSSSTTGLGFTGAEMYVGWYAKFLRDDLGTNSLKYPNLFAS